MVLGQATPPPGTLAGPTKIRWGRVLLVFGPITLGLGYGIYRLVKR